MADNNVTIRPLAESDLGEWLRLRQLLWDETSEEDHKDEMLGIIEHAETQYVGMADAGGGRLVGFLEASIRPQAEDCDSDQVGYLEGWYVDKSHRQQGIGARLVRSAEDWARLHGCTEMASDAEIGNSVSLHAHEKLGYTETSRLVHLRKEL